MKDFFKTHFQFIVIVGLVLFLFWDRISQKPQPQAPPQIVIVSDTTNKAHTGSTVVNNPTQIKYVPYPVEVVKQVMMDSALVRKVVEDYYSTKVQQSEVTFPDSLGYVKATTYTTKNNVDSVGWDYKVNERTITNTITIKEPYKPRTQVYVGTGLSASTTYKISDISLGIGFKNKKDQLFILKVKYNTLIPNPQDRLGIEVNSFWKLGKRK